LRRIGLLELLLGQSHAIAHAARVSYEPVLVRRHGRIVRLPRRPECCLGHPLCPGESRRGIGGKELKKRQPMAALVEAEPRTPRADPATGDVLGRRAPPVAGLVLRGNSGAESGLDFNRGPRHRVEIRDAAIDLLAAKLRTPLQIEQHLALAFEEAFRVGEKPVTVEVIEAVLSRQIDDLEPKLMRHGYDVRILASQFNAKPAEIRQFLQGALDGDRARELTDQMLAAGLPL
jgi:hypothetical protein